MSWLAQVGHVLKKDVRQHRWMIVITLLALAGAVTEAMGWGGGSVRFPLTSPFTLVPSISGATTFLVAGLLLVAFLVQGDSPARTDTFWVPRPLSPSAVVAAKVALAGFLLVVLPLVWEVTAIGIHHVWSARVVGILGRSVLVQTALLAAVAVVAALTPDLRTFVVAFLVAVFAWSGATTFMRQAMTGLSRGGGTGPTLVEATVWLVGGLALVAYQYRVRDTRHALRVFAVPALLCLGGGAAFSAARPLALGAGSVSEPAATPDLRVDSIRLERPPSWSGRGSWYAQVHVEPVGGHSDYEYMIIAPRLRVFLPDGSRTTLQPRSAGQDLTDPWVPSAGLTWLGYDPTARPPRSAVTFLVPTDLVKALSDPRTRFSVEGQILVHAPVELGPLPMRVGATAVTDRGRWRLMAFENEQGHPRVRVRYDGVASRLTEGGWMTSSLALTLVNPLRHEAIDVRQSDDTSNNSHNLVFMGEWWSAYSMTLVPNPWRGMAVPVPPVDDAWLDGAELYVTNWVPTERYRVSTAPVAIEVRQ